MVGQGRPVTEAVPRMMLVFRQMGELLDDPKQRAAWDEQYQRAMGSAARSMAIREAELQPRRQADLFNPDARKLAT